MNLPNILTVLRLFLTVGFIVFALKDELSSWVIATILFTLAALSDYLDGYLARKYNLITPFGKIMDPIADKFLVLSAFFIFMRIHIIPAWMFYVVAAREILVTISRFDAMRKGKVIAAEKEGKLKTVLQIVAILWALAVLIINRTPHPFSSEWNQQNTLFLEGFSIQLIMFAAVALTLYSGIKYFWSNRQILFK